MLLLYTGNGKGKTSACVGQAVRAIGQGLVVAFGQFMKRDGCAGEQEVLFRLLGDMFVVSGRGFFRHEGQREIHREGALQLVQWALGVVGDVDILLLDEALYALGSGLLLREELEELIALARQSNTHLVLSGRGTPEWLLEQADLVTEMREIKHPYAQGHQAVKGIEF